MADARITLEAVNAADAERFAALVGPVFERAPWVAALAASDRPFASVEALHAAMFAGLMRASEADKLALLRNHPELAGREAQAGGMTSESVSEQGGAGLDRLSAAEFERLADLNRAYSERFGWPFLVCVRRHSRRSIFAEFERRLARTADEEMAEALHQVFLISRLRIADLVEGPGMPKVHGHLSTHVLDTVAGRPAAGVRLELRDISDGLPGVLVKAAVTNRDGRTDEPLVAGEPLRIATYELTFRIGEYFAAAGASLAEPAFLDVVPIRFGIAEPEGRYHVPLSATPWSYATYRGS